MRFVRFQRTGTTAYGILEGDLIRVIEGSVFGDCTTTAITHRLRDVRLLTPVEPTKILCVGLNYRDHIEELGADFPKWPSHFLKPPSAVIGPDDEILYPAIAEQVDYEGELAVIVRDRVKDVSEAQAMEHVLGFTCFNDVTERTLSRIQGQLTRSKGFDTFAAFGPCVATGLHPEALTVHTLVNGDIVQQGNCADMVFSVSFLIHYLSQCMTLFPGDIISTGTPRGVGPIVPGDVVEVHIEEIGGLRNPVRPEA
jgi:2-keto-4-pentenoate hydratase/2-oxohepta-3-ene-1,7-dioic acid hydratase in catechol pathway